MAVKKKGLPLCGITFSLRGVLEADVGTEAKPTQTFVDQPFSVAVGTFTVFNDGPSSSPGGTFVATMSDASHAEILGIAPPFREENCQLSKIRINCRYGTAAIPNNADYFPVGATAQFTVRWLWFTGDFETPSPRTDGAYANWNFSGVGEDGATWSNNGGTLRIFVCGVDDPPQECQGATIEEPDGDEPEI